MHGANQADQYCAPYIAGGRGKGGLDTGTNHLGFRCVRDGLTKTETSAEACLTMPSLR